MPLSSERGGRQWPSRRARGLCRALPAIAAGAAGYDVGVGEPGGSGRTRSRAAWSSLRHDEEARLYLKARLAQLSSLMFWSFVVFLASMHVMYWQYPAIEPAREREIVFFAAGALIVLAVIWRGLIVRRTPSIRVLYGIDLFYALSTGLVLGISAYLARDFRPSAYGCVLFGAFMVFTRAIVVPSSGPRTTVAGIATFLPMVVSATAVALTTEQELPTPAYISATAVIAGVVILLATIGSRTIYGLRRQVSEVMTLGQYTLDQKIGEGGMGVVYRARHALLRRPTAVKLLSPDKIGADALDRFEREVQHMSQLTHPNTVAVYDYGRSPDGIFYYAMEYLDGITFEQLVDKYGPQPSDRVVDVLAQVCGALTEAHASGIIHRDIKPANIILCQRGGMPDVAKVVDYGLVKDITDTGLSTKVVLGTPGYVAPESFTDPDRVGKAADLYALGAVGYCLLTGKDVFGGKDPIEICVQHVTATPLRPSQAADIRVPAALEDLILRCLAKQPADRPTAEELATLLRALPPTGNWIRQQAELWWTEFHHATPAVVAQGSSDLRITVDIAARTSTRSITSLPAVAAARADSPG